MNAKWSLVVYALMLGACGGATTGGGGQSDDDYIEIGKDASAVDASNDATVDGSGPTESDGAACPSSVEPLKIGCTTANDCTLRSNNACCGNPLETGIAIASADDYDRCFPPPSCAGLGCAIGPGCMADDGLEAACSVSGVATIGVRCNAGTCESYVLAEDGGSH